MWANGTKLVCINKHGWVWINLDGSKEPYNKATPEYNKIYTCEKYTTLYGYPALYLKEFPNVPFVPRHFVPVQDHDCTKDLANSFILVRETSEQPIIHQPQTS